jgi:hypothetical protein
MAAAHMAEARRNAVADLLDFGPTPGPVTLAEREQKSAESLGRKNAEYFKKKHEAPLLEELAGHLAHLVEEHCVPDDMPDRHVADADSDNGGSRAIQPSGGPDIVSPASHHDVDDDEHASSEPRLKSSRSVLSRVLTRFFDGLDELFNAFAIVGGFLLVVVVVVVFVELLTSHSVSEMEAQEWGPARETFTWSHRPSFVVFDSATNNPVLGNETSFLSIENNMDSAIPNATVVSNKERFLLKAVFDNDAVYAGRNTHDTRAWVEMLNGTGKERVVTAYFTFDPPGSSEQETVWAHAYFFAPYPFRLTYISGTAKLWNNAVHGGLLEEIDRSPGAFVSCGSEHAGVVTAGCSGWITIEVQAQFPS